MTSLQTSSAQAVPTAAVGTVEPALELEHSQHLRSLRIAAIARSGTDRTLRGAPSAPAHSRSFLVRTECRVSDVRRFSRGPISDRSTLSRDRIPRRLALAVEPRLGLVAVAAWLVIEALLWSEYRSERAPAAAPHRRLHRVAKRQLPVRPSIG